MRKQLQLQAVQDGAVRQPVLCGAKDSSVNTASGTAIG